MLGTEGNIFKAVREGQVFAGSRLKSIRIPSTLREIKANTFRECTHLKTVYFSEGLETIGHHAFAGSGVVHVITPSSLRTIGQGSFAECHKLRSVAFCEGLETLGVD